MKTETLSSLINLTSSITKFYGSEVTAVGNFGAVWAADKSPLEINSLPNHADSSGNYRIRLIVVEEKTEPEGSPAAGLCGRSALSFTSTTTVEMMTMNGSVC